MKVEKENPNKQFIWLNIRDNKVTFRLDACYFAPKNLKFYKKTKLDKEDPYAALKRDIYAFRSLGEIVLIIDFNSRITMFSGSDDNLDNNPIWTKILFG